jgi:hypothetical protein
MVAASWLNTPPRPKPTGHLQPQQGDAEGLVKPATDGQPRVVGQETLSPARFPSSYREKIPGIDKFSVASAG